MTRVATAIVQGLGRSVRLAAETNAGFAHQRLLRERGNVILGLWHDRLLYIAHYLSMRYTFRQRPMSVLVSSSNDGALIGAVLRRLAARIAWGSSTRGGVIGARGLLRDARGPRPHSPVICLDGPKGPRHVVKPGVVAVAKQTGFPILPFTVGFGRTFTLERSWDRFCVPVPGTHARIIYGDPVSVGRRDTPEQDAASLARVQSELDRIEADACAGERRIPLGRPRD
ncbi:MAG: lysophospholipid acyltransferase family protein [Planctomycetota bacterium]